LFEEQAADARDEGRRILYLSIGPGFANRILTKYRWLVAKACCPGSNFRADDADVLRAI
jgi:hypothetical protein